MLNIDKGTITKDQHRAAISEKRYYLVFNEWKDGNSGPFPEVLFFGTTLFVTVLFIKGITLLCR